MSVNLFNLISLTLMRVGFWRRGVHVGPHFWGLFWIDG